MLKGKIISERKRHWAAAVLWRRFILFRKRKAVGESL
jgi:hypothetical protein